MQVNWPRFVRRLLSQEAAFAFSLAILIVGLAVAYIVWRWSRRQLRSTGVADAVEGNPFERALRGFGSSTVGLVSLLVGVFVYLLAIILALDVAQLLDIQLFWTRLTGYLPRLFVAALAVIFGATVGYRAEVVVNDRLRSVKLPEVDFLGQLVRYSVFYVAALVALSQIGVSTGALLILLGAYLFGVVFLGGLAFRQLLAASAAGIYLLLTEPYAIGDEIAVEDRQGIVQEVDVFMTRVEAENREYIIPNHRVVESGVVRVRE